MLFVPIVKFDLLARGLNLILPIPLSNHGHLDEVLLVIGLPGFIYAAFTWLKVRTLSDEIAKRKHLEEALAASEERFRLIFDQSTEGIVIVECDTGKIIYANETMERLLGYPKTLLMGEKGIDHLFRHFEKQDLKGIMSQSTQSEDFLSTRVSTTGKGDRALVVSLRLRWVRSGKKALVHLSLRDMTEKVRQEEQAKEAQAKLIHANKMSSLGTLVSGVAHEINNPNNFIMFNASMLADIWSDSDRILNDYYLGKGEFLLGGIPYPEVGTATAKLIEGISEGAQRIKNTVEDLKDYARQDRSSPDQQVDLNQAVLKAVSILSPRIRKHSGAFHLELGESLPKTLGNPQQIEQVIINLLLNALDALESRERSVTITTSATETDRVQVTVRDEGSGMDAETLKMILNPFFTTKSEASGTGLGLYISQMIAREHRGRLLFESEPGKGTSATLELPQANEQGRNDEG